MVHLEEVVVEVEEASCPQEEVVVGELGLQKLARVEEAEGRQADLWRADLQEQQQPVSAREV